MKKNTAINILKNRAKDHYNKSFDWLIDWMDKEFEKVNFCHETTNVVKAYKIYKQGE
tara:strand:+ start:3718 stop:3888 length:171 start_codon:yes stop_codon:yes gene_type:complete